MTLALGELVEHVYGPCSQAFGRVRRDAQFLRDAVRALEAHAVNLRRQPEGVFAQYPYGRLAVGSQDFFRQMERDVVLPQEEHDFLDFALAFPALHDRFELLCAQTGDFRKALRVAVQNIEGFLPETRHDSPGECGADVLHDA